MEWGWVGWGMLWLWSRFVHCDECVCMSVVGLEWEGTTIHHILDGKQ